MKLISLSILIWITAISVTAQDHILIKGKILDQKSKEPLPYANVNLSGVSIGTISTESGDFEFFVPAKARDDSLKVTYRL